MASGFEDAPSEIRAFFEGVNLSPFPTLITNPTKADNPIELANDAFCTLTGYSRPEILGRNCRFLQGPASDQDAVRELRQAVEQRRTCCVEIINYRRDGSPFRNAVTIMPLYGPDGALRCFVGSQVDLGEPSSGGLQARKARAADRIASLTSRQRQVLTLMSHGVLSKLIAERLQIAPKTVEVHRAHILRRLDVATSGEAIRLAIEAGL